MSDETTPDDLQEKIDAAVNAALEKAKEKHDADIKGLKDKNRDLIADKKKLTDAADELEAKAADASGDWETKFNNEVKKREKAEKERDEANSTRDTLLIDNQLRSGLVSGNVSKQYHSILFDALKSKAKVENGAATIEGEALSDYIKSFLSSDDGKHYVAAPANSGGGATGSRTVNQTEIVNPRTEEQLAAFMKFARENPAQADILAEQWQRPELKG